MTEPIKDEFSDFPFPEAARQQQTMVDFNGNVIVGNTIQIADYIGMQLGLPGFKPFYGPPNPDASFFATLDEVCCKDASVPVMEPSPLQSTVPPPPTVPKFPNDPVKRSLYTMERPPTPLYPLSDPSSPVSPSIFDTDDTPVLRTEYFIKPTKKAGAKPVNVEFRKKMKARKSGGGYQDWPFIDGVPRAHKFRNRPEVAEPKDDGELGIQPNKTLPKHSISSGLEASFESP
jgi:hypothetical protein